MTHHLTNKIKLIFSTVIAIVILFAYSCNKQNSATNINNNLDVATYAKGLMTDTNFVNLLTNFALNSSSMQKQVYYDNTQKGGVGTYNEAKAIEANNMITKCIATYSSQNVGFFMLTSTNRDKILLFIADSINSASFRSSNQQLVSKLLSANSYLANNLNSSIFITKSTNSIVSNSMVVKDEQLSSQLLIGCAATALLGALGSYGDAINDIKYIITQGWSGAALVDAAISIIGNASPWWKVASIVLTFGACVYAGT